MGGAYAASRITRYESAMVKTIPVVAPEGERCVLPGQESFNFFDTSKAADPNWRNEITTESLEKMREFDPVSLIHMLSPTALLVIVAETDKVVPLAAVQDTFAKALEPKRMVVDPMGHFDVYQEPWLSKSAAEAVNWYKTHLS